METRQLGRVQVPALPADLEEEKEEGGDDDDGAMQLQLQPAVQYTAAQHVSGRPQSATT